ncbi:MAG TPA: AAA family ATPase [Kofleriaceae bacterium]|nr:AAA family ATPase [Kofleriaceae bacterium]
MKNTERQKQRKWERYLELAAEAGSIAMALRDKPTRLDWMGVGLRVVGLGIRYRAEKRQASARDPWTYFQDEGIDRRWLEVPDEFRKLVMDHVTGVEIDDGWWTGDDDATRVCKGRIGTELVAWLADNSRVVDGPYVVRARTPETYRALGERLWKRLGSRQCAYGINGLVADRMAEGARVTPTLQLVELEARIGRFLAAGLPRSYLLLGPPGTGKSAGIRWLARRLDLSTLRVDIASLGDHHGRANAAVAASLQTLVELLRPELMILDDLDRVDIGADLLHFLELAATRCRVVMASANCADSMIGAALRPGRFDEVVRFERLDPGVLAAMLGDDRDLTERMSGLPVAYVAEFLKRRGVLGRAVAESELSELEARQKLIAARTEDGE